MQENKMKSVEHRSRLPVLAAFFVSFLIGCASTLPVRNVVEIADETEALGCKKLGPIAGNTHWGGFTGQELSLELAKKRALNHPSAKGATHVLWLKLKKGFFGASASGRAYVCTENAETRPSVYAAVMRFESIGIDSGVSMIITDIFTNQIQANGKCRVMERSQMNKVLSEQGFQSSGACNSAECAVEIGRLLSIQKMFIGSIGKLGGSWFINIRVVDIKTGEILSNVSKQVVGKVDNLSSAAIQMANELSQ
jgi:Curli production assembly/transport component CsgG